MTLPGLQLAPVKTPDPTTSPAVGAITAGFQQLSVGEQVQLFTSLIATPGGDAANRSENFNFTWTGIAVGLVVGVASLMAYQHLKGE